MVSAAAEEGGVRSYDKDEERKSFASMPPFNDKSLPKKGYNWKERLKNKK